MRLTAMGAFAFAITFLPATVHAAGPASMVLFDEARSRPVPVALYFPAPTACATTQRCPVALLSHGYGNSPLEYSFVAHELSRLGYLVASIGHEAAGDPKMDPQGDLPRQRADMARRGAATIRFVHRILSGTHPAYDWQRAVLVGHSLGGDSSAMLASLDPAGIGAVVTLDNRRAALPRSDAVRVLSLRAADTGADPGVLPDETEMRRYRACIVSLDGARHNDMFDGGPVALKQQITGALVRFLKRDARGKPVFGC